MSEASTEDERVDGTAHDRAAYRAFVRSHHPDRGGDPEVFVEGLARFRARQEAARTAEAHGSGDGPRPDRYDAPVVVVGDLPLPVRIAIAALRTYRRRARSRVE